MIGIGVLTLALASCGGADDDTPDPIAGTADTVATEVDQATDDVASAADTAAAPPASNEGPERAAVLPRTASPLPFTALVGVISLAGAAGVRLWRRRRPTRDAADEGTA
jgi:hypothetical protein